MKTLASLSDTQIIADFQDLCLEEREQLVRQLELIAELDRRKLFLHYSSLWAFLVHELGMEEGAAERKIKASRWMGRFPWIRAKLESGELNLSLLEIGTGCVHRLKLDEEEIEPLFEQLSGKSCKSARRAIARLYPCDRELPRDRIVPLCEEHSEVRFVASQELLDQLEEIKGLLAHSRPGISMGELIGVLATEFRKRHHPEEKMKRSAPSATTANPVNESRIPTASQVREIIRRDGFCCSYRDPLTEKTCGSAHGLEIHHKKPWTHGGETEVSNLQFVCHGHHARLTRLEFGFFARPAARTSRHPTAGASIPGARKCRDQKSEP